MMDTKDIIQFGKDLYEFHILPKDLGISSRQVNYWKDKKVLPFFTKEKHSKMNIPQAVWVSIINELSNIGVSTRILAQLSKEVWQLPREEKFADTILTENINRKTNPLPEESIEELKNILNDELLMDTLRTEINPFTESIKSFLFNQASPHYFLYAPKSKQHNFQLHGRALNLDLGSLYLNEPLISIPFPPILSKLIVLDFLSDARSLKYLNDIEQQIRDIVVFKRPKIVEIAFENDQIKPITITEEHKSKEEFMRYILENKIAKGSKLLIDIRSQGNYKLTLIKK